MGRRARPYWDKRAGSYRTEAGGRTHYFRGINRDDHIAIATAFAEHLAAVDAKARPPEPTVEDVCVAFLKAGPSRNIKPRTIRSHKERLLKFCAYPKEGDSQMIGARPAGSIKARDLRDALRAWETAGMSDHYRSGICGSVKAAFRWAASEEGGHLIPANPLTEVKGPSIEHAPDRYADRREVAAFLRFAWRRVSGSPGVYRRFGRNLILLIRIAAHTGARPGELCSAWWSDLDTRSGKITLSPDRHKNGRKTGKPRIIMLNPALVRALRRERDRPDRHPVSIFVHRRGSGGVARGADRNTGEPWGRFTKLPNGSPSFEPNSSRLARAIRTLRREAIAAGVPIKDEGDNRFVLYQLRHSTASDHLMSGGNPATIAELMGTSIKQLETTYGHLHESHLAEAAHDLAGKRRGRGGSGK